jgi:hypothetical protein
LFGGEDSRGRQYNDFFQLDLLVEGLTTSSSRQQSALSSALASWSLRASISECDFCKLEGHSVSVFSDPNGSKQKSKLVVFGGQQKGILRQQYQADTYIYELGTDQTLLGTHAELHNLTCSTSDYYNYFVE